MYTAVVNKILTLPLLNLYTIQNKNLYTIQNKKKSMKIFMKDKNNIKMLKRCT